MTHFKEGKTNWKYILIVVILAIVVGGGILGWVKMQEILPAEFPEIKKPEKPYIRVISPNGGEELIIGNSYEIQWECSENYSKKWSQLGIDIWLIKEEKPILKIASISSNVGINQYNWLVPSAVEPGKDLFKIKIETPDHEFEDVSDEYFSIAVKDETANWKTYRNEKYGFEFKYPSDWNYIHSHNTFSFYKGYWKGEGEIVLAMFPSSSLEEIYKKWKNYWKQSNDCLLETCSVEQFFKTPNECKGPCKIKETETLVAGKTCPVILIENTPSRVGKAVYIEVFIEGRNLEKNWVISFSTSEEHENILDQMLSTFRFIEKVQTGTIEGSLGYPSDFIPPDMKVCAENIITKELYCTEEHIKDNKYTYGEGYVIEVPAGTYYVFATLPNWKEYRAYYSEFVTCGLKVDCPSHKPIPVTVNIGQAVTDVDPQDWYNK